MEMDHNIPPPAPGFSHEDSDEIIPFDPLPCRRHDGWTVARQRDFIRYLQMIGMVGASAKAVGKSPASAYKLRQRAGAESFAQALDLAVLMGSDNVRSMAIERAVEGYKVPYFHGGRQRGETLRYDNRLLMTALNALARMQGKTAGEVDQDTAAPWRNGEGGDYGSGQKRQR